MNMMKYRGYVARIEYDEEDRIFVGHLAGIKDIVGFHGTTVNQVHGKSINQWASEILDRAAYI